MKKTDRIIVPRRAFLGALASIPFASQALIFGDSQIKETPKILESALGNDWPMLSLNGSRFDLKDLQIDYQADAIEAAVFEDGFRRYVEGFKQCEIKAKWYWTEEADRCTKQVFERAETTPLFLWLPEQKCSLDAEVVMLWYGTIAQMDDAVMAEAQFRCVELPTWTYLDGAGEVGESEVPYLPATHGITVNLGVNRNFIFRR